MNLPNTIKFPVYNLFSGKVQFTAEIPYCEHADKSFNLGLAVKWAIKTGANIRYANLQYAYLEGAHLEGVDLEGVDLDGAYLRGVNIDGAYLRGAKIDGAYLDGVTGLNDWIKCIQVEKYPITYTSHVMQIGCQRHTIEDWRGFDSERIHHMDGLDALRFWDKYKDWIFKAIELCPAKPTKEAA